MATSLWLYGNRQSIIRDRGATGSRSLSHIAEKRKGPTEQMKKAVAELPGEEVASLTGEKLLFTSTTGMVHGLSEPSWAARWRVAPKCGLTWLI